MSYEKMGNASLRLFPCRYGASRLDFRGPQRNLDSDYIAVLGGSDTYGKHIERPYATRLEMLSGIACVNFGLINAGIDVFLNDHMLIDAARAGQMTVLQVTGAQNNSNRLYSVHPRRNDRFVKASKLMTQMFRELDFTEFHFTRHLLQAVQAKAPDRFGFLCEELRLAWVARMTALIQQIGGKIIVLWFADHAPEHSDPARDPLLVTRPMIEKIRPLVCDVIEVVVAPETSDDPLERALAGRGAGSHMMSATAHQVVAERLKGPVATLLAK